MPSLSLIRNEEPIKVTQLNAMQQPKKNQNQNQNQNQKKQKNDKEQRGRGM